jgi:hypothetical protein
MRINHGRNASLRFTLGSAWNAFTNESCTMSYASVESPQMMVASRRAADW